MVEMISGDQGSGRSGRLAEILGGVVSGPVILADPAGSWTGRPALRDDVDALVLGPSVFDGRSGSGLQAVAILMARHRGAVVAIDDCELIPATRTEWSALHSQASASGCRLVLVSPTFHSGIEQSFRPSRGRARLLSRRPGAGGRSGIPT